MSTPIAVFIEHTPKRTFATAVDWPGWSRAGRSEALAVEALVACAPRYAKIAEAERLEFRANSDLANVEVVERREGSAGTEYGVPSHPSSLDARPMDVDEAHRRAGLVEAAWRFFDATSVSAPEELRKGPRGGGRDTSKIVAHVLEAERAYAAQMGIKIAEFASDDRAAIDAMRGSMLDVLRAAREGTPLAGRRWPPRYAGHRIAWHSLDHAWEIEDRTE